MNINFDESDKIIALYKETAHTINTFPTKMKEAVINEKSKTQHKKKIEGVATVSVNRSFVKTELMHSIELACYRFIESEPVFRTISKIELRFLEGYEGATSVGELFEEEFLENLPDLSYKNIDDLIKIYEKYWKEIFDIQLKDNIIAGSEVTNNIEDNSLYSIMREAVKTNFFTKEEADEFYEKYYEITEELKNVKDCISNVLNKWRLIAREETMNHSQYKISESKKTDFIKIISAMYDCDIFETLEGKKASNKRELIKTLGHFFNTNIEDCSKFLSAAKNTNNYMDIFNKLKDKGEEYYKK